MPKKADDASSSSVVVSCRVHPAIRDEIDGLMPIFASDPKHCPSGDISRADVVRVLLLKALDAVRAESEQ